MFLNERAGNTLRHWCFLFILFCFFLYLSGVNERQVSIDQLQRVAFAPIVCNGSFDRGTLEKTGCDGIAPASPPGTPLHFYTPNSGTLAWTTLVFELLHINYKSCKHSPAHCLTWKRTFTAFRCWIFMVATLPCWHTCRDFANTSVAPIVGLMMASH